MTLRLNERLFLLIIFLIAQSLHAQTKWNAPTGSWFDAANWTAGVPTATSIATIDNSGISQVSAAAAATKDLLIGDAASGNLAIASGGTVASAHDSRIGNLAGSQGTVTVSGVGSKWTNATLDIGSAGSGTLTISDGSHVTNTTGTIARSAGSVGVVTVSGTNSKWTNSSSLLVGQSSGQATLNIQNGGYVETKTSTTVGSGGGINFDGGNLKTETLRANTEQLSGTGTIDTNGLITNLDLVFDAQHGPQQQIVVGDLLINLDLNGSGNLTAGYQGRGSVRVADGVTIASNSASVGFSAGPNVSAVVTGSGSTWKYNTGMGVGSSGTGTLLIEDGAKLLGNASGNSLCHIGRAGNGVATVTGPGSTWTAQTLTLAESGDGTGEITVANGGAVLLNIGIGIGTIGGSGDGKATITGSGSKWINFVNPPWDESGTLRVAYGGHGELTVSAGGMVSSSFAEIAANFARETALVHVTGIGSAWLNSRDLYIGGRRICCATSGSTGSLSIDDGASVTSVNAFVGFSSKSTATITVNGAGSSWTNSGQITIGDNGGRGTLSVVDGGSVSAANGLRLKAGGTLTGDSKILADVYNDAGAVSPGSAIGSLQINGNYTQEAPGRLDVEIGGSSVVQYDRLSISGSASLSGTLHVSLVDGYLPIEGDTFTVLTGSSVITNELTLRGAYSQLFQMDIAGSSIALRVANSGSPGDFNLDGVVDSSDYITWRANAGSPSEYEMWRAHFGQIGGSGIGTDSNVPVPETSTFLLCLLGAPGLVLVGNFRSQMQTRKGL